MEKILVDTGVWLAIYDERDENHKIVQSTLGILEFLTVVIPWPIAYETSRTRFVRNNLALQKFENYLKSPNIYFESDESYLEEAYKLTFDSSLRRSRPLSMVDCLLRLMLDDVNINIKYFATLNNRDFFDICQRRGIDILPGRQ